MSQIFTTPAESLEIAILSLTCRLTDSIEAKVAEVGIELVVTGSAGKIPICQNLTDPSIDVEMREEGNAREVMSWECPIRTLVG